MKVYFVFVFAAVLGLALSLPANKNVEETTQKEVNRDVDFVPLGDKNLGPFLPDGVVDVDAGSFFGDNPFRRTPFTSSFNSLEAAFTRMRQLMDQLLGRVPTAGDFPELHIPNFGNVDLGKGNTTSVTKIINGHKVTINDTEYKSDEANGSSFFKVHVVEVHPDEDEVTTTKSLELPPKPKAKPEAESVEEAVNNEIALLKDNEGSKVDGNIETLDEVDVVPPQRYTNQQQWKKVPDIENFEDNRIDDAPSKPYDLSNDIYVNQLLADSGAKANPDVEVFQSLGGRLPSVQYYPEARASPISAAYNYYPNNMYEQSKYQQLPLYNNPSEYASPMIPINDPYYNRFQPEQIMIVPLDTNLPSYYVPAPAQITTHEVKSNLPSTSTLTSSKTSDKTSSAPSTT